MSSNLYARYIPPPRSIASTIPPTPVNNSQKTESPPPAQPLPPAPVTQADASATYSRYVPPSSKSKSRVEEPEPSSPKSSTKRKREDATRIEVSKPKKTKTFDSAFVQTDTNKETEPTRKNKKNKTQQRTSEVLDAAQDVAQRDEDLKHKSLLSKRDKSIRKAERLAKKAAEEAAEEFAETGGLEEQQPEEAPELHPLEPLPQPEPIPESTGLPTFSSLPPWLASPTRVSSTTTAPFSDFGIPSAAIDVLRTKGFAQAFAVQAGVLPLLIPVQPANLRRGGDVVVSAATGSGKTLAYVLPMVKDISQTTVTRLRGLIILPTRELVTQAREVCETCASAFSASQRRHIKIGIAVGNQTLKSEQGVLMSEELRYDPEEYRRHEHRLNAKWESSSHASDDNDDFNMYDEEAVSALPDHVTEYRPKVDILICTPGRLVEHLKSTIGFTLDYIKWLVIDEGDKLLDQSFQQWLPNVMSRLSKGNGSQTDNESVTKVILSATVTRDVGQLNELKLHRPTLVVLEGSEDATATLDDQISNESLSLPATLLESAVKVDNDGEKPLSLLYILTSQHLGLGTSAELVSSDSDESSEESSDSSRSSSPVSSSGDVLTKRVRQQDLTTGLTGSAASTIIPRGFLVFTKSNESAVRLGRLIAILEPTIASKIGILTSTIPHSTRKATLSSFHSGKIDFLFASDLVARGLDLSNLAHVVNYDMPTSLTSYVHRVGRTARAGKPGHAWTLFSHTEARWFWNDIARTSKVQRTARKVARVNIDAISIAGKYGERYEAALATLGEEARSR